MGCPPPSALLPLQTGLRVVRGAGEGWEAPRESTGDVTHPLDLRLEYLIDGALLPHACTSTVNRADAFRETLVRNAGAHSFFLSFLFRNIRARSRGRVAFFEARAPRCDRLVISGGIEKSGTRRCNAERVLFVDYCAR